MPLYEYECQSCGKRVELIQKHSDPPVVDCPNCRAAGAMKKLIAAPALQFKGSGWYITDYSDKGKTKTETGAADPQTKAPSSSKETSSADTSGATEKKGESSAQSPTPKANADGKA